MNTCRSFVSSFLVSFALVACGGGDDGDSAPEAKTGTVNRSGAASVAEAATSLRSSLESGNGALLASNVLLIALTGPQQMVLPAAGSSTGALRTPLITAGPNGGTVECDAGGCVYDQYSTSSAGSSTVIDGSVVSSASGGAIVVIADLVIASSVSASGTVQGVSYTVSGNLEFTSARLDGEIRATGDAEVIYSGRTYRYRYVNLIRYDELTFGVAGPIGGSVYARWSVAVEGAPEASQSWEGAVVFP